MSREADLAATFAALRALVAPHAAGMVVVADGPSAFEVEARRPLRGRPTTPFAALRIGRSYVALHVFPVYMNPDLLAGAPDALTARMHGKSCFNFRRPAEVDAAAVAALLAAAERYLRSVPGAGPP